MTTIGSTTPTGADAGRVQNAGGPILVAATGTDDWSPALEAAQLLAERDGCRVQVVGVLAPLVTYSMPPGLEPPRIPLEREREAALLRALRHNAHLTVRDSDRVTVEVAHGRPAETLTRIARKRRARLIVMGLDRHPPVNRGYGEELTLRTLRAASCPVLAVPGEFTELPRRAVVGIDFSATSVWAAEQALRLLSSDGVLTLMHVGPRREMIQPAGVAGETGHERRVGERFGRIEAMLRTAKGVCVDVEDCTGHPADELLAYASANGADLIAVGSQGLGFLERMLLGSVATSVLRHSTCAVLACPRPEAAEQERIERALAGAALRSSRRTRRGTTRPVCAPEAPVCAPEAIGGRSCHTHG